MRTAEEILNSYDDSATIHWLDAISAMKDYAKEAIEECAKLAENQIEEKGEMWDSAWRVHGAITELLKEVK